VTHKELEAIRRHVILENKRLWIRNRSGFAVKHPLVFGILMLFYRQEIPEDANESSFIDNVEGLDWMRIAAGVRSVAFYLLVSMTLLNFPRYRRTLAWNVPRGRVIFVG
jgi:hypothetical protein